MMMTMEEEDEAAGEEAVTCADELANHLAFWATVLLHLNGDSSFYFIRLLRGLN